MNQNPMIMYNVSMGWAAGLTILFAVVAGWMLYFGKAAGVRWWGVFPAATGIVLTGYGWHMSTTWPLNVNPSINPIFGEPCFILGLLSITMAVLLFVRGDKIERYLQGDFLPGAILDRGSPLWKPLMPLSWVMAALGARLTSFAWAIYDFDAVGGAPPWEPITGRLGDRPELENTFFALLYLLPGIALVLLPFALLMRRQYGKNGGQKLALIFISGLLAVSGATFLGFSVLNDYTHTGLMRNVCVEPGPEVPVGDPTCTEYKYR